MHEILKKEPNEQHAKTITSESLILMENDVEDLIKTRLVDAAGKHSRAFELEIEEKEDGSFFDICHKLEQLEDNDFIESSKDIAELLASSQTKSNIPGGYLIIIEAKHPLSLQLLYIVIKAELHTALAKEGELHLKKISDIFLSPSQKLYKIGILSKRQTEIETEYSAYLFDDQFRLDSFPATYFYKDFLGFDASQNSKLLSQEFYNSTSNFIDTQLSSWEKKTSASNLLKAEMLDNQQNILNPKLFGEKCFSDEIEVLDQYHEEILKKFPLSFTKDSTLLKKKIEKDSMKFNDNVVISGPNNNFNLNVNVISTKDELETLDIDNPNYTVLKIKGKPKRG